MTKLSEHEGRPLDRIYPELLRVVFTVNDMVHQVYLHLQ